MKKSLIFLLGCMFLTAICCSCSNTDAPAPHEESIVHRLAIIKVSPEMQKQVFVSPIVDSAVVDYSQTNLTTLYYGDGLVLCNPSAGDSVLSAFALTQLKIAGTSPYVMLSNDYAIIDWRWAHFQPLSGEYRNVLYSSPDIYDNKMSQSEYSTNPYYMNGSLANEEYYLLSVKWEELTDLTSVWSLDAGEPIEKPEIRYVSVKEVEEYGGYQGDCEALYARYNVTSCSLQSAYNLYQQDEKLFQSYVDDCNRLQALYVETLKQMINGNE